MSLGLPPLFLERLQKIIPTSLFEGVKSSFASAGVLSLRVNTLKINTDEACKILSDAGILFKKVSWAPDALILEKLTAEECGQLDLVKSGKLYRQSLSSMIPVLVLDPQKGEHILDFCAAPGSKTTQIASLVGPQGHVVAVEAIRPRFYRLKSVCDLLGATNVSCKLTDARRFRFQELFDRVLVDAPCSSESRFEQKDPDSYAYWSPRKIKEMVQKQRGLLLSASRFVKPGGILVYSTCTFAPEENEGVVSWVLKKSEGRLSLLSAKVDGVLSYPAMTQWENRDFASEIGNVLRVLPTDVMEGFFVAKFIAH